MGRTPTSRMMIASFVATWALAVDPDPAEVGREAASSAQIDEVVDIEGTEPNLRSCRRMVGLVSGFTPRARSWLLIGAGPIAPAASPAFALTCGLTRRGVAWEVGLTVAPLYRTRLINSDRAGQAWIMASTGPLFGSGPVRAGPWLTVAYGRVGGGGRVLHQPWTGAWRHGGFEYRLEGIYNGNYEVMASVLFSFTSKVY